MNWFHGRFQLLSNNSMLLIPNGDGYQQIQDPCAAVSNFIEQYNDTELYKQWRVFMDPTDGPKLHMFDSGGAPVAPLFQVYSTANLLPQELLRNSTPTISDSTVAAFKASGGKQRWSPKGAVAAVAGAFAVGAASLLL